MAARDAPRTASPAFRSPQREWRAQTPREQGHDEGGEVSPALADQSQKQPAQFHDRGKFAALLERGADRGSLASLAICSV
jgi:hypothetical protein